MTLILTSTQSERLDGWGSFFVEPQAALCERHCFGIKMNFGRV